MKFKKLLIVFLLSISLFTSVNAEEIESNENTIYSNYQYIIEKYDVDMVVNKDNSYDITETITANFKVDKHGIFRKIPIKNEIIRADGSSEFNRGVLSNIEINDQYTREIEDKNYFFKIGDPEKYLRGKKEYVIKYHYNIGKDSNKEFDELYFNIIGDEWNTSISNLTFKITMPKKFDEKNLGFSAGRYKEEGTEKVEYKVDGNIITGKFNGTLSKYEALTVRMELPENYFNLAKEHFDKNTIFMIIIPIICIIIAFILWIKYGKDDVVVESVEFYPPNDLNSFELAHAYKGYSESNDVVSLLIYLANKGYIRIENLNKKGKDKFKFVRLREYDGANEFEKLFMKGLFKLAKTDHSGYKEVTLTSLKDSFYTTVNTLTTKIADKNKFKIYDKTASSKLLIINLLIIFSLLTVFTIPCLGYFGIESIITNFIVSIAFLIILNIVFMFDKISNVIIFLVIGSIVSLFVILFLPLIEVLEFDSSYNYAILIGSILSFILSTFLYTMRKRTKYGRDILGKIKGFKRFLETAEKAKLEALVNENPTYFYDILPYTYVLGISNKWIKQFEEITIESPSWYSSDNAFNHMAFSSTLNSLIRSTNSAMQSTPQQSSGYSGSGGGGFSGGGFSGGGSGGGGGGSW